MSISGVIGEGVIRIVAQGFDKVKQQLNNLVEQTKKTSANLKVIGDVSSSAFNRATGSILGFLKAADPVRMGLLGAKLEILSIHIGTIFIPLLERAINWLDKLINYFRGMDDATKDSVLHWTEIGLAITGAGAALSVVIPIVSNFLTVGKAVLGLLSFAGGPVGILIKLLLLLAGAWTANSVAQDGVMGTLGKLQGVFQRIMGIGERLLDALPLDRIAEGFQKILDAANPILDSLGDMLDLLADLSKPFLQIFGEMAVASLEIMAEVVNEIAEAIKEAVEIVEGAVDWIADSWIGKELGIHRTEHGNSERGAGDFSGSKGSGGSTENHTPMQMVKPELIGIMDVWKKLQTSTQNDPKALVEQERLNLQKDANKHLEKIVDNTAGKSPATTDF